MKRKTSVFATLFGFLVFVLILAIFGAVVATAMEVIGIVELPEKYSLMKYLTTSTQVSVKEYDETVQDTKEKTNENNGNNSKPEDSEENIVVELPTGLVSIYDNSIYNQDNSTSNSSQESQEIPKYYYAQLDEYGKLIYDRMYENIDNLKTGTYIVRFDTEFNDLLQDEGGDIILENAFQSGLNALIYDHPEIFYLDITKMYLYTETTTFIIKKTFKVYIGPQEGDSYLTDSFSSKEEVENAINVVNQKIEEIKEGLSLDRNTNIRMVHDYLIDNIQYDQTVSLPNIYNIYGALINGNAVCEGYAKSFKYLMDQLGIESMFIYGTGRNSNDQTENHAWIYLKLNDDWYAIDPTWDDPILIGGGFLTSNYRYRYFLKGSNEFFQDHFEDGSIIEGVKFYYPTLSVESF